MRAAGRARGRRPGAVRFAVVVCGVVLAACAEGTPAITVSDARIPAPAGANGAFYLTLANDGDGDDRLVDVATDVAADAQLHQSRMEDGVMSMQPVDGIDLPAGDEAVLEPGGLHVMLVEIDQGLTEGDTVEVTLMFDHADPQRVTAEVVPLGGEH